jgi:hypothetical protein
MSEPTKPGNESEQTIADDATSATESFFDEDIKRKMTELGYLDYARDI